MILQGQVYDTTTEQGIPGASLSLASSSGSPIGGGLAADQMGMFVVNSPQLDQGAKLLVSSVGYSPVLADPAVIASTGFIGLNPNAQNLQTATVTAIAPQGGSPASKYVPIAIGGGALLWLLSSSGKKKGKRVGDIGSFDWSKLAITGGILVGGYFAGKALLTKLGIISTPTPGQAATTQSQQTSLQAAVTAAQKTGSGGQTYPADNYTGWANDIFNRATSDYTLPVNASDQAQIMDDVMNVQNAVDLQMLITAFGQREGNCGFFGFECQTYDLQGWLKAVLSPESLAEVNTYLANSAINYQF